MNFKALLTTLLATTAHAAFERRVLASLNVDVVFEMTGSTKTSTIHLKDGDNAAAAAATFCQHTVPEPDANCADLIHTALEQQLQQRIDNELLFYLEVDFQDQSAFAVQKTPFLLFQGEDVNDAVYSYLAAYPTMATQDNYNMLVQACWARLTPMEEIVQAVATVSEKPAVALVEVPEKPARKEKTAVSVVQHCSHHFGSRFYFNHFFHCVQELWHGYGAVILYQPPANIDDIAETVTEATVTKATAIKTTATETTATETTATENFGSSTDAPVDLVDNTYSVLSLSTFFMVCSAFFMSWLYMDTKWRDDAAEKDMMIEIEQFNHSNHEEVQVVHQNENATLVGSSKSKTSRRSAQRRFGSSLNNM
jgi:hypothetical protein